MEIEFEENKEQIENVYNIVYNDYKPLISDEINRRIERNTFVISCKKDKRNPDTIPIGTGSYIVNLRYSTIFTKEQMLYQLSHEFTHVLFYMLHGDDCKHNSYEEESLCVAASLCFVKRYCSERYYKDIIDDLLKNKDFYKDGIDVACKCGYKLCEVYKLIKQFDKRKIVIINY